MATARMNGQGDVGRSARRRWAILVVLCVSVFVIVMDNTILNVALPRLVEDLGATTSQLQWIVDAYTLVYAGLLLTGGSLGDRFGRKGAFVNGLAVFGLGSLLSALATSPGQLIATRSLMGIGSALLTPATLSIITDVFRDPRERGRAIAIWSAFAGLGSGLGPVIGGVLLAHFSWSSVFWVNVPVVVAGMIAAVFMVPTSRDETAARFDPVGAVLSIAGSVALLFGIIQAPDRGWTDAQILAAFVAAVVLIAAFLRWELRNPVPMVDLSLFRNPRFSSANAALTVMFFALFGQFFLLTQYLQFVKGYSPLEAGLRMLPWAAVTVALSPMSARVSERIGNRATITGGLVVVAVGVGLMGAFEPGSGYGLLVLQMTVEAAGMSMVMAPATAAVMSAVPREKAGVGSAMNNTTRQMGGALGVAVIGSLVSSSYAGRLSNGLAERGVALSGEHLAAAKASLGAALGAAADGVGGGGSVLADAARVAFTDALAVGSLVAAGVALIGAFATWRWVPGRHSTAWATPATPVPRRQPRDVTAPAAGVVPGPTT
jgi:EmrB/QacA subfamily drug resistance transporter